MRSKSDLKRAWFIKPIACLAVAVFPDVALSEPVNVGFFADVEPIWLEPEHAGFDCAGAARPARVDLNADTVGIASTAFPLTFLDRPESPPTPEIWRGTVRVPERDDPTQEGIGLSDWSLDQFGTVAICIGTEEVQVVRAELNLTLVLGRYTGEARIQRLEELRVTYTPPVYANIPQMFYPTIEGFPDTSYGQFVGDVPDAMPDGRILGRLDLDVYQEDIQLIGSMGLEDAVYLMRWNTRLMLWEP